MKNFLSYIKNEHTDLGIRIIKLKNYLYNKKNLSKENKIFLHKQYKIMKERYVLLGKQINLNSK